MDWYKFAISEQDFYDFYAISEFNEEDFRNNPKLLVQVVDHLNYIRDYYLKYLTKEIGEELFHGFEGAILGLYPKGRTSEEEVKEVEKIKNNLRNLASRMFSPDFPIENLTPQDFEKAIHYFGYYNWTTDYGGYAWKEITKWTKKLYETQLFYEKSTKRVFERIYKLIMILDTIHSLEHNTNNVLVDLPESESKWMQKALELVKHSESASYFSNRMSNSQFQEEILRNRMLSQKRLDKFNNGPYRKIFQEFIDRVKKGKYIANLDFSKLLKEADSIEIEIFLDIMKNNAELVYNNMGRFRFDYILRQLSYNSNLYTKEFLKKGLEIFDNYETRRVYINVLDESPVAPDNILSILVKLKEEISKEKK